jgi:molybdenum cofactor cytidylyltransferase
MIAAIVPAAGRSTRMGRPKLLLPIGGMALIARAVAALREAGVDLVILVAPPLEAPGATAIADLARCEGARVVVPPTYTPDMRATVEMGLDGLDPGIPPTALLLAPGDSPGMSAELVARILEAGRAHPRAIVVPMHAGHRGHPVLIPWHLASEIRRLPAGAGINALLLAHPSEVVEVEWAEPRALLDLDTPEDYEKWTGESRQ